MDATHRVSSHVPSERPEGSELRTPGLRFLRRRCVIVLLRCAKAYFLAEATSDDRSPTSVTCRAHASASALSKFTRFQMSGDKVIHRSRLVT